MLSHVLDNVSKKLVGAFAGESLYGVSCGFIMMMVGWQ